MFQLLLNQSVIYFSFKKFSYFDFNIVSQPKPVVQQTIPSWDDDFDHSDVATTVVESTLAEVRKVYGKDFLYIDIIIFRIMIILHQDLLINPIVLILWNLVHLMYLSFHNNEHNQ